MGWKEYFSSPQTVIANRKQSAVRDVLLKGNDLEIQGYVNRTHNAGQTKVSIGEPANNSSLLPLAVLCRRSGIIPNTSSGEDTDENNNKNINNILRFRSQRDNNNNTKNNCITLETIEIVYEAYPQAIREDPCLHYALSATIPGGTPSLEIIQFLLEKQKDLIVSSKNGYLPIHTACTNPTMTAPIIEYLLELHPESVHTPIQNDNKRYNPDIHKLPIHLAIKHSLSLDVIKVLVAKYGECMKQSDYDIIGGGYLEANKYPDKRGWYHHKSACAKGGTVSFMGPTTWYNTHACGTPLHIACSNKYLKLDTIRFLYNCYPKSVITKNKYGYLPFHLACKYGMSLDIISFLILKCPEAISEPTGDMQNATLLTISNCHSNKTSLQTIMYLLSKHPNVGYSKPPSTLFQMYWDEAEDVGASPKITTYLWNAVRASNKGYSAIPNFELK